MLIKKKKKRVFEIFPSAFKSPYIIPMLRFQRVNTQEDQKIFVSYHVNISATSQI